MNSTLAALEDFRNELNSIYEAMKFNRTDHLLHRRLHMLLKKGVVLLEDHMRECGSRKVWSYFTLITAPLRLEYSTTRVMLYCTSEEKQALIDSLLVIAQRRKNFQMLRELAICRHGENNKGAQNAYVFVERNWK